MHTYVAESPATVADGKCVSAASLMPHGNIFKGTGSQPECMLIVDSGFSFTHVVPILSGRIIWKAVKRYARVLLPYTCFPTRGKSRLDVGGKLLTNQLKELVSFRQWNMMDETYIMNQVKESCCFVSLDVARDLEACRWVYSGSRSLTS